MRDYKSETNPPPPSFFLLLFLLPLQALASLLEISALPLLGTLESKLVALRRRNDAIQSQIAVQEAKLSEGGVMVVDEEEEEEKGEKEYVEVTLGTHSSSRTAVLRQAGEGLPGVVGGQQMEVKVVRVSGGEHGFGWWEVNVSGGSDSGGKLVGMEEENEEAVRFMLEGGGVVVVEGREGKDFWWTHVKPILFPTLESD